MQKCLELEERKSRLAGNMKQLLAQLQQLEAVRQSLAEQLEMEKKHSARLFESNQRQQEILFHSMALVGMRARGEDSWASRRSCITS